MTPEQAKENAEVLLAYASGMEIEMKDQYEGGSDWRRATDPAFNFSRSDYRIKPEPVFELGRHIPGFRPLQDGEEWHRTDWTKEMLPDGWRPLMLGEEVATGEGRDEFFIRDDIWSWQNTSPVKIEGKNNSSYARWRTQRPLPATLPKLIPLEASDVPPGSVLAFKSWGNDGPQCWVSVLQVTVTGGVLVAKSEPEWFSYEDLVDEFIILRPGSTEWLPCSKVSKEVEGGAGK